MSVSVPVIDYIDPSTRRIYLLNGITEYHPLDDIYAEVRNLRRTDETLREYLMFVEAGGNIPKNAAGTLRTPRYAIFKNCKVVVAGDTYVSGEQLYADENGDVIGKGPDCIDHALSPYDAYIDYEPPGSEVIIISSGSGLSQEEHDYLVEAQASAVVAAAAAELARKSLHNRQEITEAGIFTVYDDDGETPLYSNTVTDKDGNAIVLPKGTPARRSATA